MNIFTEKKIIDLENRLVASQGEREGVGGIRRLGSSDTTWNGFTMRPCCVALRRCLDTYIVTEERLEKKLYTCNCILALMLYSRKINKLKK